MPTTPTEHNCEHFSMIARSALYVRRAQSNWMSVCPSVRACVSTILEIMYWGNEGWTHADPLRKWNHWNLGGSQKDTIKFQVAHKQSRMGGPTFWTLFTHFLHEKVPSLCRRKTHNYGKSGSRPLPCRRVVRIMDLQREHNMLWNVKCTTNWKLQTSVFGLLKAFYTFYLDTNKEYRLDIQ